MDCILMLVAQAQGHVAVFGCFAISAEIAYVHWAVPALALQLVLTASSLAMLFVIGRRSISEMISVGRVYAPFISADRKG